MSRLHPSAVVPHTPQVSDPLAEHWDVIRRVIERRVPTSCVEDIVQEVALAAVKSNDLPTRRNERANWLCRVALTQVALHWRKQAATKTTVLTQGDSLDAADDGSSDPIHCLIAQESVEHLHAALGRMCPEFRNVLVCKILEGKTYAEVARELGITVPVAEHRLRAAKRALRGILLKEQSGEPKHQQDGRA